MMFLPVMKNNPKHALVFAWVFSHARDAFLHIRPVCCDKSAGATLAVSIGMFPHAGRGGVLIPFLRHGSCPSAVLSVFTPLSGGGPPGNTLFQRLHLLHFNYPASRLPPKV